jgi:hypothetical protein
MIIGGVATKIGSANESGQIQVSITEDPIITLANVSVPNTPVSNTTTKKEMSAEESKQIRDAAVAKAKAEILRAVSENRNVLINQFQAAEFFGLTDQNIESVNKEIFDLSLTAKKDFRELEKIVFKYGLVDKVANHQHFFYSDLARFGILSPVSKYKTSIVIGLKKLPSGTIDTPVKIQSAAAAIEKNLQQRASQLSELIAKIRARLNR